MTSIEEIIAKLAAGTGPDRDLDCLVEALSEGVSAEVEIVRRDDGAIAYWKSWKHDPERPIPDYEVLRMGRPFTSSLDEALGLAVRMLPEKWSDAMRQAISALGRRHHWHMCLKRPGQELELPREICLQTLRIAAGIADD